MNPLNDLNTLTSRHRRTLWKRARRIPAMCDLGDRVDFTSVEFLQNWQLHWVRFGNRGVQTFFNHEQHFPHSIYHQKKDVDGTFHS